MNNLFPILAALAAGLAAAPAEVLLTFDEGLEGFQLGGDAGGDAEKMVRSDFNGGSLALSFDTGWKAATAKLDLRANPALLAELELALANGGTLSYDLYVNSDEITGTAPQWFEPVYIGNSDGVWDQSLQINGGQPGLYVLEPSRPGRCSSSP